MDFSGILLTFLFVIKFNGCCVDGVGNVETIEYDFSVLMDKMDSVRKF